MVQAARVGRAWPWFRATMGYRQPTPELRLAGCRGVDPRTARFGGSPVRWNPTRKWRRAHRTMTIPVRVQRAFQAAPAPRLVYSPDWRKAVNLRHIPVKVRPVFEAGAARLSALPSNVADSGRARSTNPVRVPPGFKPEACACTLHCPKVAESCDPASQTREGSLRLANEPGPRPVNSPNWWIARASNPDLCA